jgi:hypothetical protein
MYFDLFVPRSKGPTRLPAGFHADDGGATYVEEYKLTDASSDNLGYAVAIDGDTIVAGDRSDDNGNDSGSVYIFRASDGAQLARLVASDAAEDDKFGQKVAIDGDTIAIAAENQGNTGDGQDDGPGAVYLFRTSTYEELEKLRASDAEAEEYFGTFVAIEGGTLVAGARYDNNKSGSAYVFVLSSADSEPAPEPTPEPTPEPGEPSARPIPAPTPRTNAASQPSPRPAPSPTQRPTPMPTQLVATVVNDASELRSAVNDASTKVALGGNIDLGDDPVDVTSDLVVDGQGFDITAASRSKARRSPCATWGSLRRAPGAAARWRRGPLAARWRRRTTAASSPSKTAR